MGDRFRYAAYGLELSCPSPLPGMVPAAAPELPALQLTETSPADLERSWSGPAGPPVWRGHLGEGVELTAQQGVSGDVLFRYGERARFRLAPSRELLACAPERDGEDRPDGDCPGADWRRAMLSKVVPCASLLRGYEALHASAVASPLGALAIAAPVGMGKTTLALALMASGWQLLADDIVVLAAGPECVTAHPGTPHLNLDAGSLADDRLPELGVTLATIAGERWVAVDGAARAACRLRAVCLLERAAGLSLQARAIPANPLALAPYMLGLLDDGDRERARFGVYADLMESVSLIRLTCGVEDRPADVADLLEQTIADDAAAVAVGMLG